MAKRKRRGKCIFCEHSGELTLEHALPLWIGHAFDRRTPHPGEWRRQRAVKRPGQPLYQQTRKVGIPGGYKLPVVCRDNCNNGWMKGLEDSVKPFLEPLMFAETQDVELTPAQMLTLAKWTTKTALIYELLERGNDVCTDDDRQWFGTNQRPFTESRIYLAAFDDHDLGQVAHVRRTADYLRDVNNPSTVIVREQMLTLMLGFVVLQAIIVSGSRERPLQARRPMPNRLCSELWPALAPNEGPITWPPPLVLDAPMLQGFSKYDPTEPDIPILEPPE